MSPADQLRSAYTQAQKSKTGLPTDWKLSYTFWKSITAPFWLAPESKQVIGNPRVGTTANIITVECLMFEVTNGFP